MRDILLGVGVGLILGSAFLVVLRITWLSGFNAGYRDARDVIRLR